MHLHHIALAIVVAVIWGFNFVMIKAGLDELPPILLCALRFFLLRFRRSFFIRRPSIAFRQVAAFGFVMFALQFTLLFFGMAAGTTAGLASLLLQVQVFFTILLAVMFLHEKPSVWQIAGAIISFSGIGLVAANLGGDISALGMGLIIAAAASWGAGNLISKRFGKIDMLALVIWEVSLLGLRSCWCRSSLNKTFGISKAYPGSRGALPPPLAIMRIRLPCWALRHGTGY